MDARHAELAARATRVQTMGPITDYFGCGPRVVDVYGQDPDTDPEARLALCRCKHGKEWPEGGGGPDVCGECSRESMRVFEAGLA